MSHSNWRNELEQISSWDNEKAINKYKEIIANESSSDEMKEEAIHKLAQLFVKTGNYEQVPLLLRSIRPFFDKISKPKTDRIDKEYNSALQGLTSLLWEIKKLDDKPLLVEIQLIESRIQHALKNIPKARAALTSARTNANTIYCPPRLQAEIDMQSGVLHSEEKDYKTAYSYFYESFETYDSLDDPIATKALKYMLLCKIMTSHTDDVYSLINGKIGLKYQGKEIEAMKSIAKAHSERSLQLFENSLLEFKTELTLDPIIHNHLSELYNNLLEQNLCRIIEPFSRVEISHIAKLIKLPVATVEKKLSLMILDKKYNGILDQGTGTLIVFDDIKEDKLFTTSLETINSLGRVVDLLYEKANKLS
eukprot:gene8377-10291_t